MNCIHERFETIANVDVKRETDTGVSLFVWEMQLKCAQCGQQFEIVMSRGIQLSQNKQKLSIAVQPAAPPTTTTPPGPPL